MRIINLITELFVKLKDGLGNAITSTDMGDGRRGLDVNAQFSGTINVGAVKLEDGDSTARAVVDEEGRVYVSVQEIVPLIISSLPEIIISSLPDIILRDASEAGRKAVIDASGRVFVSIGQSVDLISMIRDGSNADNKAKVDSAGNLYVVTPAPETPAGKVSLSDTQQGDVTGIVGHFTVIPNGSILTIQRFKAGAETNNGGSKIELFYAPNGNTTGLVLIEALYLNGSSAYADLNYATQIGNGTRAILLRRSNLHGGANEIFGKWEGYY